MDPCSLAAGFIAGACVAAFFLSGGGRDSPRELRAGEAAPKLPEPEKSPGPGERSSGRGEGSSSTATATGPEVGGQSRPAGSPLASEPGVVSLRCPQCGAPFEDPGERSGFRCTYCDAAIWVEKKRRQPKPRRNGRPPFVPSRPPSINEHEFGRFQVAVLRQAIVSQPRCLTRWLPLDEQKAALVLVRCVSGGRASEPLSDPELLHQVGQAIEERVRERQDPGLALKAGLKRLLESQPKAELEAFVAVFDSGQSQVVVANSGCQGALIHASVEEGRPIDRASVRQTVGRMDLEGDQRAFQNLAPIPLAARDAVLLGSHGLPGGRDAWSQQRGAALTSLRDDGWLGDAPRALVERLHDALWTARERSGRGSEPPAEDLLLVTLSVSGNQLPPTPPQLQATTFASASFDVALVAGAGDAVAWIELPGPRQALVWLSGEGAAEIEKAFVIVVKALLGGETGDNENARRAGRDGLSSTDRAHDPNLRALVLYLHDEHGKAAFWTRGWSLPLQLLPRGERGGNMQWFDEGGEAWLKKPGDRLLFPGSWPASGEPRKAEDLASSWPGGKASALYALLKEHEDEASSEDLLRAAAAAGVADAEGALPGLLVLGRKS